MIAVFTTIVLTFLMFYLAALDHKNATYKKILILSFIVVSSFVRIAVNVKLNKDYLLYYNFKIFSEPNGYLGFFIGEPYLYFVHKFFSLISLGKDTVFLAMYGWNFIISTSFFVWLLTRKDIEMWKKMLIFVFYYFLITFTLLRNGPAYILFAVYFYYTFRNTKFYWVLVTPFMHLSSYLLLITYLHKNRYFYKILLMVLTMVIIICICATSIGVKIEGLQSLIYKIKAYSNTAEYGVMHLAFFSFVLILVIAGFVFYRQKMMHPILLTTIILYSASFFINPVVAHRLSPYVIFSLLLFPFDRIMGKKMLNIVNYSTIVLLPVFVYSLIQTHNPELVTELLTRS